MLRVLVPIKPYKAEVIDELAKADRFGHILCLADKLPPFKPETVIEFYRQKLLEIKYDPMNDCILMVGNVILTSLFMVAVSELGSEIRLLIYDAREAVRDYQLVTFSLKGQ